MITVSQLKREITELNNQIAAQRALMIERRAHLRELRQAREYKITLMRQLEEQGRQSIDTSWMKADVPGRTGEESDGG